MAVLLACAFGMMAANSSWWLLLKHLFWPDGLKGSMEHVWTKIPSAVLKHSEKYFRTLFKIFCQEIDPPEPWPLTLSHTFLGENSLTEACCLCYWTPLWKQHNLSAIDKIICHHVDSGSKRHHYSILLDFLSTCFVHLFLTSVAPLRSNLGIFLLARLRLD